MAHFKLDLAPILSRAAEVGVKHVRHPIKDFDPLSLRRQGPKTVRLGSEAGSRCGSMPGAGNGGTAGGDGLHPLHRWLGQSSRHRASLYVRRFQMI